MVILHYIASPFWGGGEQYVFDLCIAMQAQFGVRCVFVCQPDTSSSLLERWKQVGAVYTLYPHTKNGKFDYREAWHLAQIIQRENVDVVHVHNLKEYFICVYAKIFSKKPIRLIATQHLVAPAKNKCSWRWAYRHIDAFVFVSHKVADIFLCNEAVRRSCKHAHVIHNCIPEVSIPQNQSSLRQELKVPQDLPLVLYHGRICKEKGILQLLRAIVPTFSGKYGIVLAGDVADEDRAIFEALMDTSALQGYIFYLGFRTDIAWLITQCDFGVVPSIVAEAASLSLLEHMSLGTAVISSNTGAQPEFAEHGKEAILLSTNGDWTDWLTAIDTLCADSAYRQALGKAAYKRMDKDFNYNHFVQQIYTLYAN